MVYDESGQVDMGFHMQNVGVSFRYKYDPMDMTSVELWKSVRRQAEVCRYCHPESRLPSCYRRTQYGGERTALRQIRAQRRCSCRALYRLRGTVA